MAELNISDEDYGNIETMKGNKNNYPINSKSTAENLTNQ